MSEVDTAENLVGRSAELKDAVARLVGPSARGCALIGGAGMGKTFLSRFVLDEVAEAGMPVVRILATRSAATIPLGALSPFLPEAGDGLPAFKAAHAAFDELAGGSRLVIFVDDAHLLDDASAAVLLDLSLNPSFTFLLTVRSGEPCPDAVSALWRDHGVSRIALDSFDVDAVHRVVESMLGGVVPDWVAAQLTRMSGGQPFMVTELVRSAHADGRLVDVGGSWELTGEPQTPSSLLEIVARRVGTLGTDHRDLLTMIALCEPVPAAVIDELGLWDEFESLAREGFVSVGDPVRPDSEGPVSGRWSRGSNRVVRLHHPSYAEAAFTHMNDTGRRSYYATAAKALEAVDNDPLRATLWWHWAGEKLSSDRLLAAARHCYWNLDYVQSGELASAAWRNDRSVTAGHLSAFTLRLEGRCEEAELLLGAAEDLAVDDRERALIASARAENRIWGMGDSVGAASLCRAAEERIDEPHCRAEVVAYRALGELLGGQIDRTIGLVEPLLDVEVGGRRGFATAAWVAELAMVNAGRVDDVLALAAKAIPINEALVGGEPLVEPGIHQAATALAMIGAGRLIEVAPMLELGFEMSREITPTLGHPLVRFVCGRAALHRGHCDDAIGFFLGAVSPLVESRRALAASWCESGAALGAALQASVEKARQHLSAAAALLPADQKFNRSLHDEARGWLAVAEGHDEKGREVFTTSAAAALQMGDRYGAARLHAAAARNGGAAEAVGALRELAGVMQGDLIGLYVAQAEVLAGSGDAGRLLEVATAFEAHGCDLEAAELVATAARVLRKDDRSRDAVRVTARARDLLGKTQGARTPLVADLAMTAALTARELEIARLAAGRLTSGEIGARLGIKVRTVDNHLHNVYAKLGVSRRSELADVMGGSAS